MSKIHAKCVLKIAFMKEIEDSINARLILDFFNLPFYMYDYQLNINNVTLRIVVTTVQYRISHFIKLFIIS